MNYSQFGRIRNAQAPIRGLGLCISGWDDFFFDSSRVEYANQVYQGQYGRCIPQRVADELRSQEDDCDRDEISAFVNARPPRSGEPCDADVQAEADEAKREREQDLLDRGIDPNPPEIPQLPADTQALPPWVLPAFGGILALGVVGAVLLQKKGGK